MATKIREDALLLKIRWLSVHLPYEVLMFRFCSREMRHEVDQLKWNAYLACYATSGRNLKNFFCNKEKSGNNFKASEFVHLFQSKAKDIEPIIEKIDPQIFHLSKERPINMEDKLLKDDIKEMGIWIEKQLAMFLTKLPEDLKIHYNQKGSELPKSEIVYNNITKGSYVVNISPNVPDSSSLTQIVRSGKNDDDS